MAEPMLLNNWMRDDILLRKLPWLLCLYLLLRAEYSALAQERPR